MKVIALYSMKGGVGKSTAAVNLAYCAAAEGHRTLLWDLDPQGAATFQLRVKPRVRGGLVGVLAGGAAVQESIKGTDYERLDLLPADFSYRDFDVVLARGSRNKRSSKQLQRVISPLSRDYDLVFLDCSPGMTLVSENVFAAADALAIPTIPTVLSLRTLARLMKHLKASGEPRGKVLPFFSMVDRRKTLHKDVMRFAVEHRLGFSSTDIPYASDVERTSVQRQPLATFAGASASARAFEELWKEIHDRLDTGATHPPKRKALRSVLGELGLNGPSKGAATES